MAEEFALFNKLVPRIAALPDCTPLTKEDLLVPTFQLYGENGLDIYYIPCDYVNPRAKVVVVGITPGFTQMDIAYRVARQALLDGLSPLEVCKRVDSYASFAGTMRINLVAMLNGIGLPEALDIETSASLFGSHSELLHSTSAVRYPVFVNGENYAGHTPRP